jgi:hypothetical protein
MVGKAEKWSFEEDKQLILLHKTNMSIREMAAVTPNRTKPAVAHRIIYLRRKRLVR